jgi:hypothetical protein
LFLETEENINAAKQAKRKPFWKASLLPKVDMNPFYLNNVPVMGNKCSNNVSNVFIGFELQCLRGYHCDNVFHDQLHEVQLELLQNSINYMNHSNIQFYSSSKTSWFCFLLLRDDILYIRLNSHPYLYRCPIVVPCIQVVGKS